MARFTFFHNAYQFTLSTCLAIAVASAGPLLLRNAESDMDNRADHREIPVAGVYQKGVSAKLIESTRSLEKHTQRYISPGAGVTVGRPITATPHSPIPVYAFVGIQFTMNGGVAKDSPVPAPGVGAEKSVISIASPTAKRLRLGFQPSVTYRISRHSVRVAPSIATRPRTPESMPVISPPSAVEDAVALTKSADDDFAQMQPATSAPTLQSDLCPTDTDIHVAEETQAHPLPSDAPSAQDTPSWPVNDTQPAKKIAFYAWNATLEPQITPALFLVQSESTAVVLAKAKTAWSRLDPRHRCIIIAPWSKYQGPPFNAPLRDLVIDGPNLSDTRRWWSNVLWTLKKNDLAPYRVALDWETGMTYWHIKGTGNPDQRAQFQAVWEDAEAFAKLPDELRKINPDQINWQVSREAVITWNHYATQQRTQALRQAYAEPLHETFPNVRITNYGDMHFAGSLRDANGWPLRNSGLTDESSPVLYRENAADNLALIRGVVDVGGKPPVPWVSHPSYIGRDVWEATIRGAYDLGVREFLYWNPDIDSKAADDDQFAASVIADLSRIQEAHAFAAFD